MRSLFAFLEDSKCLRLAHIVKYFSDLLPAPVTGKVFAQIQAAALEQTLETGKIRFRPIGLREPQTLERPEPGEVVD